MPGFSDTIVRRPKRLKSNLRHVVFAFAFIFYIFNAATAQNVPQPDIPTPIDPIPAPNFVGAKWINNLSANEEFLQDKVVLVNFWATWCPPCIKELPSIQKLWSSLDRDHFEVVAVNVGEKFATVQNFLDKFDQDLEFAIVLDVDLEVYKNWDVRPIPTTYIVDRENNQRYKGLGEFDFDSAEIRSLIQKLIQENSNSG